MTTMKYFLCFVFVNMVIASAFAGSAFIMVPNGNYKVFYTTSGNWHVEDDGSRKNMVRKCFVKCMTDKCNLDDVPSFLFQIENITKENPVDPMMYHVYNVGNLPKIKKPKIFFLGTKL